MGSVRALVKGQQLPLPSAELPEPTDLPPSQQNPFRDVPKLITHLPSSTCLSRILGKLFLTRASPSGLLIAPIRGVCRALTGYWLSVHTRHSAVGVLSKHCLFMSDISKFRSHSPATPCLGLYINQCLESLSR